MKRPRLGKYLDREDFSQEVLVKASKVSRNTISRICSDPYYTPNGSTIKRIMNTLKQLDSNARVDDFFDI
ncbi:MAG: helix-turn-helix domain-containing protein [Neobacillus sp.]